MYVTLDRNTAANQLSWSLFTTFEESIDETVEIIGRQDQHQTGQRSSLIRMDILSCKGGEKGVYKSRFLGKLRTVSLSLTHPTSFLPSHQHSPFFCTTGTEILSYKRNHLANSEKITAREKNHLEVE